MRFLDAGAALVRLKQASKQGRKEGRRKQAEMNDTTKKEEEESDLVRVDSRRVAGLVLLCVPLLRCGGCFGHDHMSSVQLSNQKPVGPPTLFLT